MASCDRHTNSGRGDADLRIMHDLMSFIHHLHFFLGVVIIKEDIDLRDQIVCDLVMFRKAGRRKDLRFIILAFSKSGSFFIELIDAFFARTGYRLIGADDDAFDAGKVINRLQCHQHDDGGAVRICDDAFVLCNILRIDLRNDERYFRIHAEGGGVVNDYSTAFGCFRCQRLADAAACKKSHINVFKRFGLGFLYRIFLAADHELLACTAFGGQKLQGSELEISFFKQTDKFLSDGTSSTKDGDAREFTHSQAPHSK